MLSRLENIVSAVNKLNSITDEDIIMAVRKMKGRITCPYCKSPNIVKIGYIMRSGNFKIQRYKCKNCNRTFTELDGTPLKGAHSLKDIVIVAYLTLDLKLPPSSIAKILPINRPKLYRAYKRVITNKEFFRKLIYILLKDES
ncbi:Hypothetical protein PAB2064 [Pyrococcus abyssi GE5]|nr:Hypothetical protein PAB2064 [Pyrococcus abyssi GE5]